MPIYEYKCDSCGQLEEHLMKHSDPDPQNCGACGGNLKKAVSQTSFSLKGQGWYVTDYKKSPPEAGATAKTAAGVTGSNTTNGTGSSESGGGTTATEGASTATKQPQGASSAPGPTSPTPSQGTSPTPAAPASKVTNK